MLKILKELHKLFRSQGDVILMPTVDRLPDSYYDYFYKYVPFKYVCVTFCLGLEKTFSNITTHHKMLRCMLVCGSCRTLRFHIIMFFYLILFYPLSKIKCYESQVIFLMYIFSRFVVVLRLFCFLLIFSPSK